MSIERLLKRVRSDKAEQAETGLERNKREQRIEQIRKQLADYIRVGTVYFKRIMRTDRFGLKYETLERWKIETLQEDFKQAIHELNVYLPRRQAKYSVSDFIEKYDAFCNVPDNTNYSRVIDNCYNLYSPIIHETATWHSPEDTKHIEQFLVHIFGEQIDVALDYLTILLLYPKQILPILCLVSQENNTGKTTFLNFMKAIFQNNAVVLNSDDFQDSFNSHYASKLLVMIDENFVEVEKRKEKERIKQLGTASKIMLHLKGADRKEIDYYGKLIMTSNYEENFIRIDAEDIRFWVIKVPAMQERDPDILAKMIAEIPAFLDFLRNKRAIKHPKTERHWFSNELLETQARKKVIENTKPMHEEVLDSFFQDYFDQTGLQETTMSVQDILNENQRYNHIKYLNHKNIKEYLRKNKYEYTGSVVRYSYTSIASGTQTIVSKSGRVYRIRKRDEQELCTKQDEQLPF
jgi:hypothetical protein